jgi:hypothetical protein
LPKYLSGRNCERVCPAVHKTDGKAFVEMRQRVPKNDRRCPTQEGFVNAMRIDPSSFWTQDKLGSLEISVILGDGSVLCNDNPRIPIKGKHTVTPCYEIRSHCKVAVDLNGSILGRWRKTPEELELSINKSQWNRRQVRRADRCVDCVNVMAIGCEELKFRASEWTIRVVNNHVESFHRKHRNTTAELVQDVSVDKHPISIHRLRI